MALRRPLFALPALILCGAALAQSEFYASNETGMAFEEIPSYRQGDFDYSLELRRDGSVETRIVRKRDGSEFRRWEYSRGPGGRVAKIVLRENEEIRAVEEFGPDGRIDSYESHGRKGLDWKTRYEYRDKRLASSRTEDAAGSTLYTDSYRYALNGSLREILRAYPDGRTESSGLGLIEGRVLDSWHSKGGTSSVDRYAPSGEIADREVWEGAVVLRSESTSHKEGGTDKERQVITDSSRGVEIERLFDEQGRISLETAREGGKTQSRTEYSYGASGKLERKTFTAKGRRNVVVYSYAADGKPSVEEESENGHVLRRVIYQKDGSYWEELLHEGQVTVRVRWADGWKREEEILRDGKVLRRREFK